MSKKLYLRVSGRDDALDRFEAAWHLASGRAAPAPLALLSFASLPLLAKTLSPARWQLLEKLRRAGPLSIYALAKLLRRDYKNVHTDIARLVGVGMVGRTDRGLVQVAWDTVKAEIRL